MTWGFGYQASWMMSYFGSKYCSQANRGSLVFSHLCIEGKSKKIISCSFCKFED